MDAVHAQKWRARANPAAAAKAPSRAVRCLQSRHSPVSTRASATMMRENTIRHAAMTIGSALERRTRGPANEIPMRDSARTHAGERRGDEGTRRTYELIVLREASRQKTRRQTSDACLLLERLGIPYRQQLLFG